MTTQGRVDEIFIIPPPPSTTILLTDDYLSAYITPPPPPQFGSNKKCSSSSWYSDPDSSFADRQRGAADRQRCRQHSDVDSDYHSVGDSPVTPDIVKLARDSPIGASPSTCDESYIRTTLPADEVTVRPRNTPADSHHIDNHQNNHQNNPQNEQSPLHSLLEKISVKQELRQNRMYSSLQRPSTAKNRKLRERRGSHEHLLQDTRAEHDARGERPQSPRDEDSVLGNFGFEGTVGDVRYKQAVLPDVHGAIDHFIRSEQRYISDINSLLNLHIEPLRYQGCLNIDVINSLKSSLLRLLHFHQRNCGDFEFCFSNIISQSSDGSLPEYCTVIDYMCDVLMGCRGGFKTYINFCCNRAQLIRNIGQMDADETSRWERYQEQCNPSGDPSHSLEAGLAMPVQRITDYPAMLTEIRLRGGIRTGALAEKLGRTCTMLEGVSKAVDERLQMQQEFNCLYRNNKKLEVLIGPIEELLHYGSVVEVKSRDIDNFVPDTDTGLILLVYKKGVALVQKMKIKKKHSFNKLLNTAAPAAKQVEYQLKKFYPVSCLQVRDLPHNHVFEMTDTVNQQRLILASRVIEAKAELIKSVADIILDYDKFLSSSLQMKDAV